MGEKIGYARVSSKEQNLQTQMDYLREQGVKDDFLFLDKCSGAIPAVDRPGFQALMQTIRPYDTLVVFRLDRLSRVSEDTKRVLNGLYERNIMLQSSDLPDLTQLEPGMQQMVMSVVVSVLSYTAQAERETLKERQRLGIERAKGEGKYQGRPKKYAADSLDKQGRYIYHQIKQDLDSDLSYKQIQDKYGVGSGTVTRIKREEKGQS